LILGHKSTAYDVFHIENIFFFFIFRKIIIREDGKTVFSIYTEATRR